MCCITAGKIVRRGNMQIASILAKYKEVMEHSHGWDVELQCNHCGWTGVPLYNGWIPSTAMNFEVKPTIYANLRCPECGKDLKEEAGTKLVELFKDVELDKRNKAVLAWFILALVGIPAIIFGFITAGVKTGLWGNEAYTALTFLPILIAPAILLLNYNIGLIRHECECGGAGYIFMGMLGRAYCYRCSSCGKLLKIRD